MLVLMKDDHVRVSVILHTVKFLKILYSSADPEGVGQGVRTPPLKSRVSKQYWSGSPKNHIATKPAFNVGVIIGQPAKHYVNVVRVGSSLTKLSGSAHVY